MTRQTQARTTYTVSFDTTAPRRATQAETGRVPRVARMLALAHRIDGMVRAGELRDLADAAWASGVTRARVTQIVNLLLLAPAIQEQILDLPPVTNGRDPSFGAGAPDESWRSRTGSGTQLELWERGETMSVDPSSFQTRMGQKFYEQHDAGAGETDHAAERRRGTIGRRPTGLGSYRS